MTTKKYDLHTADYSVQGADAILTSDMEQLDDVIPSREIVILGETVIAYQALYQKPSDSKWYKAQANGVKQPCQGIALEGRDIDADEVIGTNTLNYTCNLGHISALLNKPITGANWATYWTQGGSSGAVWVNGKTYTTDEIRIHRMGKLLDENGDPVSILVGATVGAPVYLDPNTAGALTQTPPADNSQIIGYALSATGMLVMIMPPNIYPQIFSRGGTILLPAEAINVIVWNAPFACIVKAIKGYRIGGTGATINARKNGANNHLASALSLTNADTWMDGGAVQNVAYAIGHKLEIMIVSVTGNPDQIAVQIDFIKS